MLVKDCLRDHPQGRGLWAGRLYTVPTHICRVHFTARAISVGRRSCSRQVYAAGYAFSKPDRCCCLLQRRRHPLLVADGQRECSSFVCRSLASERAAIENRASSWNSAGSLPQTLHTFASPPPINSHRLVEHSDFLLLPPISHTALSQHLHPSFSAPTFPPLRCCRRSGLTFAPLLRRLSTSLLLEAPPRPGSSPFQLQRRPTAIWPARRQHSLPYTNTNTHTQHSHPRTAHHNILGPIHSPSHSCTSSLRPSPRRFPQNTNPAFPLRSALDTAHVIRLARGYSQHPLDSTSGPESPQQLYIPRPRESIYCIATSHPRRSIQWTNNRVRPDRKVLLGVVCTLPIVAARPK